MFSTPFAFDPPRQNESSRLNMSISQPSINVHPTLNSLIAIGNPIVDIIVDIDKQTIDKYGLEWGQTVFANERNIGFFDEIEKKPIVTYAPGGSILNSLRICSWCLNMQDEDKGQFKLTMLGSVGDDIFKDKIMNSLKEENIQPLLQIIHDQRTSRCAVGIYKKERSLVPEINASSNLSEEFLKQNESFINNHDALLIEGYFLKEQFEICKKLCEEFNRENKLVILTLSAVVMVNLHFNKFLEIANKADMIIGNMAESEVLAGGKGQSFQDTFEKIHKKLNSKDRTLVVTCGSHGVYCSKFNYTKQRLELILQIFPNFIKDDEIVDLNGTGDAFLGGFMAMYLKGKSLNNCCRAGNDAASIILRNVGCTYPRNKKLNFEEIN